MDLIRENYDFSPTSDDDDQTSEPDGAVHRPSEELVLYGPVARGSDQPDLLSSKTIIIAIELHRRHFPLGGHVTTATRETTSNAGILLRCWAMFGLVKYQLGIVLVTK
jgi:hypothetical protein